MTSVSQFQLIGVNASQAIKVPCRVCATSNITLSGEQTIDGVAVVTDDRVLVTGQTDGTENGIYVADTGTWSRAADWDGTGDIVTGTIVRVHSGTSNSGYYAVTTTGTITIGTTSVTITSTDAASVLRDDLATTSLDDGTKGFHLVYYPLSAAENTAGVTPTNYEYEYGDLRRYGAAGDDSTDDLGAWTDAIAVGGKIITQANTTYWIDINSLSDALLVQSNTHIIFYENTNIRWDYFGGPLFVLLQGISNVTFDNPSFIWDGTASGTTPNSTTDVQTQFGLPSGYKPSMRPYMCNIGVYGADNVTINDSSTVSATPDTSNKSIPTHIAVGPKTDFSQASNLTIHNLHCNDISFGVLGNGYDGFKITGELYCGRYDDYSTYGWGAPSHFFYLTDNNTRSANVEIGDVYDKGEYIGTSPDGAYGCVKVQKLDGLSISKITSFRPHGAFDSYGVTDGYVGPIFWKNTTTVGNVLSNSSFKIDNDGTADSDSDDIYFESVSLIMPTLDVIPIKLQGRASGTLKNIVFGKVYIEMDASSLSTSNQIVFRSTDCAILDLTLKTSATTGRAAVVFQTHSDGNYVRGKSIGAAQETNISSSATGSNYALIEAAGQSPAPGVADQFKAVADNNLPVLFDPVMHSSRTQSAFSSDTSFSQDFTLPGEGVYLVSIDWIDGAETNSRAGTWLVTVKDSGSTADYADTQQIGSDIVGGSILTAIGLSVTSAGVCTATATASSSRSVYLYVNYTKIGLLAAV